MSLRMRTAAGVQFTHRKACISPPHSNYLLCVQVMSDSMRCSGVLAGGAKGHEPPLRITFQGRTTEKAIFYHTFEV